MARILLIDDDLAVLRAMQKTVVRGTDHDVKVASHGNEAKDIMKKNVFDLIITDILMPDIEGFELINHIASSYPDSKIIAISGGGKIVSEQYLSVAIRIGAEIILKKPFSGEELLQAISDVLQID